MLMARHEMHTVEEGQTSSGGLATATDFLRREAQRHAAFPSGPAQPQESGVALRLPPQSKPGNQALVRHGLHFLERHRLLFALYWVCSCAATDQIPWLPAPA